MAKQELIASPYDLLGADSGKAIRLTQEVRKDFRKLSTTCLDLAAKVRLIYELFETTRGGFDAWIKYENLGKTKVYELLNVDKMLNCPTIGKNSELLEHVDITGLYEMAKPSTPAPAIKEVIKQAKAGNVPSAKEVKAIVKKHKAESNVATTGDEPKPQKQKTKPQDPEKKKPFEDAAKDMRSQIRAIQSVSKWFTDAEDDKGYALIDLNAIKADARNLIETIKVAMPHETCPYCKGKGCKKPIKGRMTCDNRGWLTKEQFEGIPEERKK